MLTLTMNHEAKAADLVQFDHYPGQHKAAGLLLINDQHQITYANRATERLLGYDAGHLIGLAYQVVQPQSNHHHATGETKLLHKDGRLIPVELSLIPLPQLPSQGQLIAIADLRPEADFTQALIHTQRLAAVGTMTSSVAHEITNPLSIITNTCSNLYHELQNDELSVDQLRRYIDMIEQSARRCIRIVETLRNYTYRSQNQMAVTDLNMIVQEALQLVEQQFRKEDNITIEQSLDPDLKSILCDHDRMIQVAINLLINARNAMQPQGGVIRIKTWSMTTDSEPLANGNGPDPATQKWSTYYGLSVSDSGHGIPPQALYQIFEPFFTTQPRTNTTGSGLGLTIAREIVHQHNGRIWAENNATGGATFTVLLPQRKTQQVTRQP